MAIVEKTVLKGNMFEYMNYVFLSDLFGSYEARTCFCFAQKYGFKGNPIVANNCNEKNFIDTKKFRRNVRKPKSRGECTMIVCNATLIFILNLFTLRKMKKV